MNKVVAEKATPDPTDAGQAAGAQTDDLDSVLNQIDQEFDKSKEDVTKVAPETTDDLNAKVDYLIQNENNQAIDSAVKSVRGMLTDLDVSVPDDEIIEDMLHGMARKDARIREAFDNRHKNPALWQKVLKGASAKIADKFSVDTQVTRDREIVASAIRGSGKTATADDNKSFEKFQKTASDYQIQEWKITGRIPESYKG